MANNKKTMLVIYCSDPRFVGEPETKALESMKSYFKSEANLNNIESIDRILVPGPDALAHKFSDTKRGGVLESINELLGAHNVVAVALAGHSGCAGNPATDEEHRQDTIASARYLREEVFVGPVGAFLMIPPHNDREFTMENLGIV